MAKNGEAIYGTRGAGLVKNADGTETAKTVKDGRTFAIAISTNGFPVVTK